MDNADDIMEIKMNNISNINLNGISGAETVKHKNSANNNIVSEDNRKPDTTDLNNSPLGTYNRVLCSKVNKVENTLNEKNSYEDYYNCILGGALGDALGRPVERLRTPEIIERYGKSGIRDLQTMGLKARITDDTQMTMFTAEGLIRSALKNGKNAKPDYNLVYQAYEDWYKTQTQNYEDVKPNGWLSSVKDLYSPIGPGRTCLNSLKEGIPGSIENPVNNSYGCGGVMRVAPAGLMYDDPKQAFEVGAQCAALTHGGKEAYLPSGFHAAVISNIRQGKDLETAFKDSLEILKTYDGYEKTYDKIVKAMELAKTDIPTDEAIESLGYGFTGDEAMAISTYCIFKVPDNLKEALILSVNHSGDSDSTGAITGNILGLYLGLDSIPQEWKDSMELKNEMSSLAKDMSNIDNIPDKEERYPI